MAAARCRCRRRAVCAFTHTVAHRRPSRRANRRGIARVRVCCGAACVNPEASRGFSRSTVACGGYSSPHAVRWLRRRGPDTPRHAGPARSHSTCCENSAGLRVAVSALFAVPATLPCLVAVAGAVALLTLLPSPLSSSPLSSSPSPLSSSPSSLSSSSSMRRCHACRRVGPRRCSRVGTLQHGVDPCESDGARPRESVAHKDAARREV